MPQAPRCGYKAEILITQSSSLEFPELETELQLSLSTFMLCYCTVKSSELLAKKNWRDSQHNDRSCDKTVEKKGENMKPDTKFLILLEFMDSVQQRD